MFLTIFIVLAVLVVAGIVWLLAFPGIRRGVDHDRTVQRRRARLRRHAPHEADRVAR
jgi:hypothetical protein